MTSFRHDLGHVLAHGQTIRHTFAIPNRSSNPLKLLAAEAATPCCSTVGRLPDSAIPPGGAASVEVIFRPGSNSGAKSLKFAVRTDRSDRPIVELILTAHVHPSWEFRSSDGSLPSTTVGSGVRRVYRGIGHGQSGERPLTPIAIESTGGIVASLTGQAVEATLPGGLVEATCEISIDLPASDVAGPRRGGLTFRWGDGRIETQDFVWVVNPAITAVPSALVLKSSASRREVRTIQLQSVDRPFRVLSVTGIKFATPVSIPADSSRSHRLDLEFDPTELRPGVGSSICIETDHDAARRVNLGILILAAAEGSAP